MQEYQQTAAPDPAMPTTPASNHTIDGKMPKHQGKHCLKAIRRACRAHHFSRVFQNTYDVDRDFEKFLFDQIRSGVPLRAIADRLAYSGVYDDMEKYPAACRYLRKRGSLTADVLWGHVCWRLAKWPLFPAVWETELLGSVGREGVAFLLHEANSGGGECGDNNSRLGCGHFLSVGRG